LKKVLITGAAGNLGGLLAAHINSNSNLFLNLLIHQKDVNPELRNLPNTDVFKADLSDKSTLGPALKDVDVIVHFAGILFKHDPEKFLPVTNTAYFRNLVDAAIENNVKRIILISFPHVEGETTIENPSTDKLNGKPGSMHARTRLEEEKYLFAQQETHKFEAVSQRVGMVYGKGILMIDAAKWFSKHKLLCIWEKPTWIHLISTIDFLNATANAIIKESINGIYNLGDEGIQTLQEFFDDLSQYWGYKKPHRTSVGFIMFAARLFEFFSFIFNTKSPLTRDFIKIGMASYYGDTTRMRRDLLNELKYKTYKEGINTF
jgi:nucleoside-diphosphate-sugar epimerase